MLKPMEWYHQVCPQCYRRWRHAADRMRLRVPAAMVVEDYKINLERWRISKSPARRLSQRSLVLTLQLRNERAVTLRWVLENDAASESQVVRSGQVIRGWQNCATVSPVAACTSSVATLNACAMMLQLVLGTSVLLTIIWPIEVVGLCRR